jgi:hypothetical protein
MSEPQGTYPAKAASANRGLLCAICEHLNPLELDKCESCHAHLYIYCGRCNTKNQRVHSRCVKCNRRLHRSVGDWVKASSEPSSVNFAVLGLVLLGILAAIFALLRYARIKLPFLDV